MVDVGRDPQDTVNYYKILFIIIEHVMVLRFVQKLARLQAEESIIEHNGQVSWSYISLFKNQTSEHTLTGGTILCLCD